MTKIFISHSTKDNEFARQLADALIEVGIEVWIDLTSIRAGKKWSSEIQYGLDQCDAMILILSTDAMASVNVEDEWQYFLDKHKRENFFIARWKPTDVHFQLKRVEYVDFHEKDFEKAFENLYSQLEEQVISSRLTPGNWDEILSWADRLDAYRYIGRGIYLSHKRFPLTKRTIVVPPPHFEWIEIPSGKVTIVKGGYLSEDTTFEVDDFAIAKYSVTNEQFARFITAGGYDEKKWWTETGWQRKEQEQWTEPRYWKNIDSHRSHHPVVGVSWYEAMAFCQWLSEVSSEKIALPTEQQWQRAAEGNDGRLYPWGNDWDVRKCNNSVGKDWRKNKTSHIRRYEGKGNSSFGVVDMAGNVWEWCITAYITGSIDMNESGVRVLRGGSWIDNDPNIFSVYYRFSDDPTVGDLNGGLRCVRYYSKY